MNGKPSGGMMDQAVRQSAAYGTATILSRATLVVALLVLPFILTPRDYGALSMIVTVTALVVILIPLEIAQAVARFYAPASAAEKKRIASTAWTFLLMMLVLFLVAGQVLAAPLCRLILGDLAFLPAFRIALPLMALTSLFYFLQNQCRWEFRTAEYVLISLVFSFFSLALSLALGLVVDPPLTGVVLGQGLGAAIAVGLGIFGLRRSFELKLDREKLSTLLQFSLPLVPAGIALFLSVHASRLILNGLSSLEDVGLYTLAAQIAGIATLGIVGVQGALTPLVMKHHQDPRTPAQLARLFELFFGFAVVASLALGLFAPEFIRYLGNPAYADAGPLVLLLAPGLLFAQMYVFAPGFAIARRTMRQMWVSVASAGVAVAANFAFIQLWGITGAALATLLAGSVFLLLWFVFSQPLYRIPVRWANIALGALGGVLIGAAIANLPDLGLALTLAAKAAALGLAALLVVLIGLVPFRTSLGALRKLAVGIVPRPSSRRA
ncbi:lipopolysaccharide biosynthesis protein [Sphingosinicella sp. CPCC 101087]|uniref:lipopolysaccharide biosynthesis protein n=1 Tax=Sphingosinicella sp. CPCC 101087 TaxID=2497754 RepID=UPI00101B7AA2|nr:oligosaccharide flippase family protein [Sphingosinicella sp. CPCC 101087]